MGKCDAIKCRSNAIRSIRTRKLCLKHYLDAIEHGADLSFDLAALSMMVAVPEPKKKPRPFSKHDICGLSR